MNRYTGLTKSKDEAVYQYLIDHAKATPTGYRIMFYIKNRSEWEGKIRHRMKGNYRNDERELEEEQLKAAESFIIGQSIAKRNHKKFEVFRTSKNPIHKVLHFIYKNIKNYIVNYG